MNLDGAELMCKERLINSQKRAESLLCSECVSIVKWHTMAVSEGKLEE